MFTAAQIDKAISMTTDNDRAAEFIFAKQEEHDADDPFWVVDEEPSSSGASKNDDDILALALIPLAELRFFYDESDAGTPASRAKEVLDATKTIEVILEKALKESKRKINVDNKGFRERVGCKPGGINVLTAMGFERSGNFIEMTVVPKNLAEALSFLKEAEWNAAVVEEMLHPNVSGADDSNVVRLSQRSTEFGAISTEEMAPKPSLGGVATVQQSKRVRLHSPVCLSKDSSYFEIELVSEFKAGQVHIGVCHAATPDAWDGEVRAFECGAEPFNGEPGDTIGLGLQVGFDGSFTGLLVFTKNGETVATKPVEGWEQMLATPMHPCITLSGFGAAAKIKPSAVCSDCKLSETHPVFSLLLKARVVLALAESLVASKPLPKPADLPFDVSGLTIDAAVWADHGGALGEDWSFKHDVELVRLMSKLNDAVFRASATEGLPPEEAVRIETQNMKYFARLRSRPFAALQARALVLRAFARLLLDDVLPLVEIAGADGNAFAALAQVSSLVPTQLKKPIEDAVKADLLALSGSRTHHPPTVYIDRIKASSADMVLAARTRGRHSIIVDSAAARH